MATNTWIGGSSNDWFNPANWSLGTVPGPNDDVLIPSGDVTESGSATVNSITVDSGATFTLGAGSIFSAGSALWHNNVHIFVGGSLSVLGAMDNEGVLTIGGPGVASSAQATIGQLQNTGTVTLEGAVSGTSAEASLNVGSFSGTETGTINVDGDAKLELPSAITNVAGNLSLYGANAVASIGSDTTDTALSALTSITGTLDIESNNALGAGDASLSTAGDLNVSGVLEVDATSGAGGSNVTIGGILSGTGVIEVGNAALNRNTSLTIFGSSHPFAGFSFRGSVVWRSSSSYHASITVDYAAPTTLPGEIQISGNAGMSFESGEIMSIAAEGSLELDGAQAAITTDNGAASALANLSENDGTLSLQGNTSLGAGGDSLTIGGDFVDNGVVDLDTVAGSGGSNLTIDGALLGTGAIEIGNSTLGDFPGAAPFTYEHVTGGGAFNEMTIGVHGNAAFGSDDSAELDIGGGAPTSFAGHLQISGDASLNFTSGDITTIAAGGSVELDGAQAAITTDNGAGSALANLSENDGALSLQGNTSLGAGPVAIPVGLGAFGLGEGFGLFGGSFSTLNVDTVGGAGGSSLIIDGGFTNEGAIDIGNASLSASTYLTEANFSNSGSLTLTGNGSNIATLQTAPLLGSVANSGDIAIGAGGEIVTPTFDQTGGQTTVEGQLNAGVIEVAGGTVDFQSALTSTEGQLNVQIGADGTAEFDAGVSAQSGLLADGVTFAASSGALDLGDPSGFGATVAGFCGSDVIDLTNAQATHLSYAPGLLGGVLTVSGTSGTMGQLNIAGLYSQSNFALTSDGHGGTDIVYKSGGLL